MVFALLNFLQLQLWYLVDPTEVFYSDPAGPSYVVADPDLVGSKFLGWPDPE
jgi:hypothetical protein